jgi:hypothetical protein
LYEPHRAKDADLLTDSTASYTLQALAGEPSDPDVKRRHSCLEIVRCNEGHPRRAQAEAFVHQRFLKTHDARVRTFMPTLLLLADSAGELLGVAGLRSASEHVLFLERYLSRPIEAAIAGCTGSRVRRESVVEIGNFACRSPQAATAFVKLLPRHLLSLDHVWIAFTATASLRRILRHLGARCADLGPADGACVRGGADDWGRYYASEPRVMAGYLPLARRIPALWSTAHGD